MGRKGKKKQQQQQRLVEDPEQLDDSEDEEIDEDGAFNSDDERKYGAFFADRGDDEEGEGDGSDEDLGDDDDDDDDEEEEEGDGGQYMLNLLNNLDSNNDNNKAKGDANKNTTTTHIKESPFAASSASGGSGAVTLDSLMEGLQDTPGFGHVQRSLQSVATGRAVAAPAARPVAERALRQVHYQQQTRQMGAWQSAVQEHRHAETLDFRPKERCQVTRDVMVDSFVPTTDFERQIHAALQEAGAADEESLLKREEDALAQQQQDDLGNSKLTVEQLQERRGQLAKMRALLFYHEQKRHHMNKIKSKQYRRIRKRQRQRAEDAVAVANADDPALAQQLAAERDELERIKERATLAHKNTSKWAKRILKRGKHVDADTRRALSAQVQRGDDLRKKMQTTMDAADADSDEEEADLVETAKKVLAEAEDDDNDDNGNDAKGLFKMKFMQRGVEKQRAQARQEARQLLLELQQDEEDDGGFAVPDDDDDAADKEERATASKQKKKRQKRASKEDMKQVLEEGSMVASSLQYGTAGSVAVSSSSNIAVDDAGFHKKKGDNDNAARGQLLSQHQATLSSTPSATNPEVDDDKKISAAKKQTATTTTPSMKSAPSAPLDADEANPWLLEDDKTGTNSGTATKDSKAKTSAAKSTKKKNTVGFVDVDRAVDLLDDGNPQAANDSDKAASTPAPIGGPEKKITSLTQEELVRKAFATQSEQEVDEEFAKEKAMVEEREDPLRKKRKEKDLQSSSGWGSWAGAGAPPPRPKKFPKKLEPPEAKANHQRQRVDAKRPNVILSERRVKKTADKFMLSEIPYPFTSREEYERSMAGGVGREWNVTSSFKDMTRPEIITRAGKVIQPLSKKVKQKRAPAKF